MTAQFKKTLPYLYALLLFALHFIRIFDNSFWGDEGYTIRLAQLPVGEMIAETAGDVHPPLYYLLVRAAYLIGGSHGAVYHLVSLIPFGLTLLFALFVIRRSFGTAAAAFLMTCCAMLNHALNYAVEARMYSWANFFVLLVFYSFYQVLKRGSRRDMAVFCLFSLAAAYTHYYALLSVAFFYAALLPVAAWKKNGFIKKVLLLYLAAFIGYLPWFFVLLSTFQRTSSSFWLTAIPSYKEALLFLFQSSWGAKLFWAFLLTVLFYFLYESGLFRMTIGKRRVDFSFFLRKMKLDAEEIWIASGMISVLGTIAVGELVSRGIRPMFQTSYIYPVASVAWLILAVCAGRFRPGRLWLMVLTLAVLLSGVPQYISVCHREKAVDQATASFLATVPAERGDVIWTDISHLDWTLLDYYYPDVEHHLLEEDVALPETDGAGRDWLFLREPMDMEAGEDFSFWAEGKLGTSEDIYVYQSP